MLSLRTQLWIRRASDHPSLLHHQRAFSSTDPSNPSVLTEMREQTFARQQDKERKRTFRLPRRESNSNSSIPSKRRRRCAETGKCMANANLGTPVLMPTEKTNYKRRLTYQAILRLKSAPCSTLKVTAPTERDANSCILSMTSRSHLTILPESKNAQDLRFRELNK